MTDPNKISVPVNVSHALADSALLFLSLKVMRFNSHFRDDENRD